MSAISTQEMLNKPFFVVLRVPKNLGRFQELLADHLKWVVGAEQRGEVFASGPFVGDSAAPGELGGMTILRAASIEEAKRILGDDPFISNGVYAAQVRKWLLMEGGFSLTVAFSNGSYRLL